MKDKESPFGHCLIFASNALARETSRIADEGFREFDMGYSHAFIVIHAAKHPGTPIGEISQMLMLSPSTVTRLCEKLEKSGYLKRVVSGRSTKINPTTKASKTAPAMQLKWDEVMAKYAEIIGIEQSAKLTNKTYKAARKLVSA